MSLHVEAMYGIASKEGSPEPSWRQSNLSFLVSKGMRSLPVAGRSLQHVEKKKNQSLLHTDLRAAFAELISIKEAAFCLHTTERQGVWPTPLDQAQDKAHLPHAAKKSPPSKVSGPRIASLLVIGSPGEHNIRLQFFQTAGCALQLLAANLL